MNKPLFDPASIERGRAKIRVIKMKSNVLSQFREGKSMAEIAEGNNLELPTVEGIIAATFVKLLGTDE